MTLDTGVFVCFHVLLHELDSRLNLFDHDSLFLEFYRQTQALFVLQAPCTSRLNWVTKVCQGPSKRLGIGRERPLLFCNRKLTPLPSLASRHSATIEL